MKGSTCRGSGALDYCVKRSSHIKNKVIASHAEACIGVYKKGSIGVMWGYGKEYGGYYSGFRPKGSGIQSAKCSCGVPQAKGLHCLLTTGAQEGLVCTYPATKNMIEYLPLHGLTTGALSVLQLLVMPRKSSAQVSWMSRPL